MTSPGTVGGINVGVGADAGEFTDELEAAMDAALSEVVDAAGNAFGNVSDLGSEAADAIAAAARSAARTSSAALQGIDLSPIDQMRTAAVAAEQSMSEARQRQSRAAQTAAEAERDLSTAVQRTGRDSDESRAAFARLTAAEEELARSTRDASEANDRLQRAQNEVNDATQEGESAASSLGGSFGEMTGKIAGAAAGLAGVAVGMDALFESFDRQDLGNQLAAQLNLTAEDSAAAGKIAGDLYAQNYGESFEQVNEATGAVLSSLGNLTDDGAPMIQALTEKALTLSSVFGIDVNEAAQAANSAIRNGLAKDGPEAFDLIGRAMQSVPVQMRDELIPVMGEYGGVLSSMGFTGAEAFGLIVNAAQGGAIEMDKAGDAIKEFGIRATDLGDKGAQDALESMGLVGADMANQLLAGGETAAGAFDRIVSGLRSIEDPAEQAAAATALFGTPLEDLDKSKIPLFLAGLSNADGAMGDFTGSVDAMGESISQGPAASLETFKRGLQTTVIDTMGRATRFMLDHMGVTKALAAVLGTLVGAYVAARVAAVVFATYQGIAAVATGAGTVALAGNSIALGAYAIASGVARAASAAWAGVQWALNAALSANPIALVVIAIAALVAGVIYAWNNFEGFRNVVLGVWDAVKGAFVTAWESVIKPIWDSFVGALVWVGEKLSSFWTGTVQPVLGFIGSAFGLLWDGIQLYFRLWGAAFEVVGTALSMLWNGVILPVLGWIGDRFVWLWQEMISPVIGWIVGGFQWWLSGVQNVWGVVSQILGWVGDKFVWLWNVAISPIIGWIVGKITEFGNMMGWLWDKFSQAVQWIWDKMGDLGRFFGGVVGDILGFLGNAGSALYGWGRDLIQGMLNGAGSLLSKIGEFFLDKIPGWIKDPFKKAMGIASPSKVFAAYGVNLGEGLIAGVDSMTSQVQSASQQMADAAGNVAVPSIAPVSAEIATVATNSVAPMPMPTGPAPVVPGAVGAGPAVDPAAILPGWEATGEGIAATASETIDPALAGMSANVGALGDTFPAVNDGVIQPAMAAMGTGITATKDALIDPALWGIQGNMAWTGQMTADTVNGVVLPQWGAMGAGIMNVKASAIDPAFAGIQGGLQTVQGAFATGVGAISSQWDQMRGAVSRPVRFAIDTVFNNGLVGMWNSVSDLIGTKKMAPYSVGGFAKGTSVLPGYSPGVDNMPFLSADGSTRIDLSGGEGIARPEVVRALGPDRFDGLNAAARMGGAPAVEKYLGGFAGGGVIDSISSVIRSKFPGMTITSTQRNGDPGYHGRGKAVDFSNGSDSTAGMRAAAAYIAENYGPPITAQLIHQPFNRNIGQGVGFVGDGLGFYGGSTMAGHRNHVHWAANAPVPLVPGGPIDPALFADTGGSFDVGSFVNGKLGEERSKITAALGTFQQTGTIGTLPSKVFDSMNGAMQKKIDEGIAAASAAGAVSMGSSANLLEHSKAIADSAKARGMGREGALIGLMTGLAESGIRILANPAVPASFTFPHEGVGQDHDSVGIFQQRQAGWGTLAQRMNARGSADLFFNKLGTFNWRNMDPGAAAQKVQVSAVPDAYGRQRGRAQSILDQVFDLGGVASGTGLMAKNIIRPERVLGPEMTEQFERFLPLLEGLNLTGSGKLQIGGLEVAGNGNLRIENGRLIANADVSTSNGDRRTVMVNQYITGDSPREIADRTKDKLIGLLP